MTRVLPLTCYRVVAYMLRDPNALPTIAAKKELYAATMAFMSGVASRDVLGTFSFLKPPAMPPSTELLSTYKNLYAELNRKLGGKITYELFSTYLYFLNASRPSNAEMKACVMAVTGELITQVEAVTNTEMIAEDLGVLFGMNALEAALFDTACAITVDEALHLFQVLFSEAMTGGSKFHLAKAMHAMHSALNPEMTWHEVMQDVENALHAEKSLPRTFRLVKLESTGCISPLSPFWAKVITFNSDAPTDQERADAFMHQFLVPLKESKSYSGAIARVDERLVPSFNQLLKQHREALASADLDNRQGINMLIFGASSLNRYKAVEQVLDPKHTELYEAPLQDARGDEASIIWVAQRLLEGKNAVGDKNHILVVRDANRALSWSAKFSFFDFGDRPKGDDMSSDEKLLSSSLTPTLWFSSDASNLKPETIGRFLLHIEVKPGTRDDRKKEIQAAADKLNLPPHVCQALAKYLELATCQVETAAKVVNELAITTELGEADYSLLLALVEESQKALERTATEELRSSVTTYSLDLLNVYSQYNVHQIIKALEKKRRGTMCFYGLPGTGKTQLAEYIADKLNMPLLIKRASDIMSKWVGDNEKNIAEMFREAKSERALLLLDEADTFLRDRSMARDQWQVSMVNELLQQMERFDGLFICTSNLFEHLDAAALRRFTFKLNFMALSEAQRVQMFENETGVKLSIGSDLYDGLMMIKNLTPGDFATVKRQCDLFDEKLTPEAWLTQLEQEAKAKLASTTRGSYDAMTTLQGTRQ